MFWSLIFAHTVHSTHYTLHTLKSWYIGVAKDAQSNEIFSVHSVYQSDQDWGHYHISCYENIWFYKDTQSLIQQKYSLLFGT